MNEKVINNKLVSRFVTSDATVKVMLVTIDFVGDIIIIYNNWAQIGAHVKILWSNSRVGRRRSHGIRIYYEEPSRILQYGQYHL
jgi:hypothetical protein